MSEIKDIAYKFGCGRYRQEAGLLDEAGDEITRFGRKAVIVGGKTALGLTKERLEKSLEKAGVEYRVVAYAGHCSYAGAERIERNMQDCDMVVGVGGGRIMDLAKLLACRADCPVINIPTSSATCAAVTALSVLYKDDGSTVGNFYPRKETDAVLVDTEIMAKQPPRFLAAGYIDALAKYIEIKNGKRSAEENNSAMDIITANVLAEHTYQNLTRLLPAALDSLERKTPTDDLDSFLFLSIPVTGIISGISKGYGQSAIGHEFYYCVRTLFTQEALQYLHGEIVGIGLLVQTYYNQTPELVAPLADMMKSLSMPLSLPEIGISGTVENFERIYNMILKSPFVGGDIDSRRRFREGLEIVMR